MNPSEQAVGDHSRDFTIAHYRELLDIAKRNYEFVRYSEIANKSKFLLWRHDIDFSLNRAFRLAQIEREMGIVATYFINLHSEFYNPLEKSQTALIKRIIDAGHDIGLHFDAEYYEVTQESQLEALVSDEIAIFDKAFGVIPTVFSFHNPTDSTLNCDRESYGGLTNCYSKRFKSEVDYCSDSNGYWRFQRLADLLNQAKCERLQVLTHPGWWQETAMPPRKRVFRAVFGRAQSVMGFYDEAVHGFGRLNYSGSASILDFLRLKNANLFNHFDYLWNSGQFSILLVELYRLHIQQVLVLCRSEICNEWGVAENDADRCLNRARVIEAHKLFELVFERSPSDVSVNLSDNHEDYTDLVSDIVRGAATATDMGIEQGCVYLAQCLKSLSDWGVEQPAIQCDGIAGSAVAPSSYRKDDSGKAQAKWIAFRANVDRLTGNASNIETD